MKVREKILFKFNSDLHNGHWSVNDIRAVIC